jgi:hypothetical protein
LGDDEEQRSARMGARERWSAPVMMRATRITRERREKRGREKEEEADGLSFGLVASNGLARLSHVICSGATETQVAHGEWPISHATAVGATESRQSTWPDSSQRGATSAPGHMPAP